MLQLAIYLMATGKQNENTEVGKRTAILKETISHVPLYLETLLMMLVSSLIVLGILSAVQARVVGGVGSDRTLQGGMCNGVNLWTIDEVRAYSKQSACLVVLYDTVYNLQAFADIHRGGSFSITRNCGKDATFGYESLVCIAGVPDHNRGILNMVQDDIVGYIKDSDADPCANSNPDPIAPPDFEDCTVYDVLQCDHLPSMPNGGKWTLDDVMKSTTGCVVALYNYVYDLGSPPQPNPFTPQNPGSLTFAEKHGGGPQPVLGRCKTDMTDVFENWVTRPGAPDHTKGAMNAIIGYLVGVIEGSDADPCVYPPPDLTAICDTNELTYWTMLDVQQSSTGCVSVVLGKVYDLEGFAPHHYGGSGEILEHCRQDITDDFFEKTFHTLVQLGAIQQFQIGVIQDGMADPCGGNYDANPDRSQSGSDNSVGSEDDLDAEESDDEDDSSSQGGDDQGESGSDNSVDSEDDPDAEDSDNEDDSSSQGGDDQGESGSDNSVDSEEDPDSEDSDDEDDSSSQGGDDQGAAIILCFPSEATVNVDGNGWVAMKHLKIGDRVLVGEDRYEPIYSFGHKDTEVWANYLQLVTVSGIQLEISREHLVFVDGRGAVPASHVKSGDKLYVSSPNDTDVVKFIESVIRKGAYAPFTPSGAIVVNGVQASTFVALQDSPYLLIGGVSTGISYQWMEHTFEVPHRLWCSQVASCDNETYTNGISTWVELPQTLALWFVDQNAATMALVSVPLFVWLCFLGSVDWAMTSNSPVVLAAVAFACLHIFVRIRMAKARNKDQVW